MTWIQQIGREKLQIINNVSFGLLCSYEFILTNKLDALLNGHDCSTEAFRKLHVTYHKIRTIRSILRLRSRRNPKLP